MAGEEFYDAALRHVAEIGSHRTSAAVAIARKGPGIDQYSASGSLLLGCGLNFTAAIGGQDADGGTSPLSCYGKVGYRFDLFSFGETMLAADYARNEEIAQANDLAESFSVAVNQRVDPVSSEVYATVRQYALERPGETVDDLWIFMSGIKLSF